MNRDGKPFGHYRGRTNKGVKAPRPAGKTAVDPNIERLTCVAIVRNGTVYGMQEKFREHYRIRDLLGDEDPYNHTLGDIDGFMTSKGRFANRTEAREIGAAAGQCSDAGRELISSDINKW